MIDLWKEDNIHTHTLIPNLLPLFPTGMSRHNPTIAHHHVTASHSPTPSSSPPSLSLDDVEPVHFLEAIPSRRKGGPDISIRTPNSSMRRSVSSYSVDDANYHPNTGSSTSISTIATTAVLAAHHPHQHFHRHAHLPTSHEDFKYKQQPKMCTAYPLVTGLRSQVDTAPAKSRKTISDVSKLTQIKSAHLHSTSSSSSSSSSRGRFRKFAVKVVKWIRQSVVESRAKSEVRPFNVFMMLMIWLFLRLNGKTFYL